MTAIPNSLKDKIPKGALYELYEFITPPRYKLPDWVEANIGRLNLEHICQNSKLAEKYIDALDAICWYKIASLQTAESITMIHRNFSKFYSRSGWICGVGRDMKCFYKICSTPHLLALDIVKAIINIFDKKCWEELCRNHHKGALDILYNNPSKAEYFDWVGICQTHSQCPELITLLEKFPDMLSRECWRIISKYDFAIPFLEKNQNKSLWFDWRTLSKNGGAIPLLKNNTEKLIITNLALNPNPGVIEIIQNIMDTDPAQFRDSWFWYRLCSYAQNTETFKFLDRNIDRLDEGHWTLLSKNANAIPFLQKYPQNIDWDVLCENQAIYMVDREASKQDIVDKIDFKGW